MHLPCQESRILLKVLEKPKSTILTGFLIHQKNLQPVLLSCIWWAGGAFPYTTRVRCTLTCLHHWRNPGVALNCLWHTLLVPHKMWPVGLMVCNPGDCRDIKFVPQSERQNGVEDNRGLLDKVSLTYQKSRTSSVILLLMSCRCFFLHHKTSTNLL